MTGLLSSSVLAHWRRMSASAGVTIQYKRGAAVTRLTAVPGRTTHEVTTADGAISNIQTADWLVKYSDLNLTPERGRDQVELLNDMGETTATYVVTHPVGGEPWRWSDQYKTIMRIMTVER